MVDFTCAAWFVVDGCLWLTALVDCFNVGGLDCVCFICWCLLILFDD